MNGALQPLNPTGSGARPPSILSMLGDELRDGRRSKRLFLLLAETFQALGDSSRLQIVWALSRGELCVGEIAELLQMSQPAVSHHLRTLRNLKLVRFRKDGRLAFYSLDDEHIERLLKEGIEHVEDILEGKPSGAGAPNREARAE